jgi:hypothetical protein
MDRWLPLQANKPQFPFVPRSHHLIIHRGRTFELSFQTAMGSCCGMRAGVEECGLIYPVLFSLYVNGMLKSSHHVDVVLYTDDMAILVNSPKLALLFMYLESNLSDLQRWLSEWRFAITSRRAHRYCSCVSDPISNTFRGANRMGRHNSLSWGEPGRLTSIR